MDAIRNTSQVPSDQLAFAFPDRSGAKILAKSRREQAGVEPTRISFTHSLRLLRVFCTVLAWTTAPANLPKRLMDLDMSVPLLLLPERRSERRYPRHVKIKMSTYKRNPGRTSKPPDS